MCPQSTGSFKNKIDIKKGITVSFTRLNLLSSLLHFRDHDTVRGERTIQPPLGRTGPDAVPTIPSSCLRRNYPQLRSLVLACAARHSSKYCLHGHHCFLPEDQISAKAGTEKAHGICSKGWNFILNLMLCYFVIRSILLYVGSRVVTGSLVWTISKVKCSPG